MDPSPFANELAQWSRVREAYACPVDHAPLAPAAGAVACTLCERTYSLRGGVLDLDVVQNAEREEFDDRFRGRAALSEAERESALRTAERFLSALGRDLHAARVLDVACGGGALTYGLLTSSRVANIDVFCFDHSIESLRVFLGTVPGVTTSSRLHPSIQDVHRLAYSEEYFDVVLGNAVLHHFLEYEAVLAQIHRVLKPGGVAVFAEPVAYGYLWATFLMQLAARQADDEAARARAEAAGRHPWIRATDRILEKVRGRPREGASRDVHATEGRRGLLDFIVTNTFFRMNHYADKAKLSTITDKHYFLDDEIANLAGELGFTARFAPYEPPGYYVGFMRDMLRTYAVEDPAVVTRAEALYSQLRESIPDALHRVVPHFQFIILQKA